MYDPIAYAIPPPVHRSGSGLAPANTVCASRQQRVGAYIFFLRDCNGLPPFHVDHSENTIERLERLYRDSKYIKEIAEVKKCKGGCTRCNVDFVEGIRTNIALEKELVGFMCLKCVKAGNFELRSKGCDQHEK